MELLDLLAPENILILDAAEHLQPLVATYGYCFAENPAGLYLNNGVTPILLASNKYYKEGTDIEVPIEEIPNQTCNIVDVDGKVVLTAAKIITTRKHLSTKSTASHYAAVLLCEYIRYIIDQNVEHIKVHTDRDIWETWLSQEGVRHLREGTLNYDLMFEPIRTIVQKFIGPDTWNIYFVALKRNTIIVEKSIDFRIYDWTQKVLSGEIDF